MASIISSLIYRTTTRGYICGTVRQICGANTHWSKRSDQEQEQKKIEEHFITLIDEDKSVSVIAKEDAEKLAKRRQMSLVFVKFRDGQNVFKICKRSSLKKKLSAEDEFKSQGFKGLKNISFSSAISDHDRNRKINNMKKWLAKGCVVETVIDGGSAVKEVHSKLENLLSDLVNAPGTVKKQTETTIKVVYVPKKKSEPVLTDGSASLGTTEEKEKQT